MKSFFPYYGGKWRIAPYYPEPMNGSIVEPFAGGAGYATRYPDRRVTLVERDPNILQTWHYLLRVSAQEVLALPDIPEGQTVDDLAVCDEAKLLIGWWLNPGSAQPKKRPGLWMRMQSGEGGLRKNGGFWGAGIRRRIASQVDRIRHWVVIEGSYEDAPDVEATWFVDPPYELAGKYYRCGSGGIDFRALGDWCRRRRGQTIVCENEGATWLPFVPFLDFKTHNVGQGEKVSHEVVWYHSTNNVVALFGE